ncbi:MAG: hypothetical protein RIS70_1339 [Planctomycetota bacterium]
MNRLVVIDGLRGIGAISIALYHIFRYGPLPEAAKGLLPDWMSTGMANGWMAVQWFFVMAGIGATFALRSRRCTLGDVPGQIGWRVLRLGPAYWLTVLVTALLTLIAILGFNDGTLNETLPTLPQLAAHLTFSQDVLGYDCLTTGIWFIAIALQLEIAFVTLFAIATMIDGRLYGRSDRIDDGRTTTIGHGLTRSMAAALPNRWILVLCFAPLTLWSLFDSVRDPATDVWFHHFFCLYMLGVVAGWQLDGRLRSAWFWALAGLIAGALCWQFVREVCISLVAAVTIVITCRMPSMQRLFGCKPLQYLGRISYSLFLVHYPVSWLVGRVGYRLTGDQPLTALAWLMLGLFASIAVADLMYRFVERPALEWGRAIIRRGTNPPKHVDHDQPSDDQPKTPHFLGKSREAGRRDEVLVPGASA